MKRTVRTFIALCEDCDDRAARREGLIETYAKQRALRHADLERYRGIGERFSNYQLNVAIAEWTRLMGDDSAAAPKPGGNHRGGSPIS